MKMKIYDKLNLVSHLVVLLILTIGLFSLYTMDGFSKNSRNLVQINNFVYNLNILIGDYWLLIHTDNLDDYDELVYNIRSEKIELDLLYEVIRPIVRSFDTGDKFDSDISFFVEVSDDLIEIQKEVLFKESEFVEKAILEKVLRHKFRDLAAEVNDLEFTNLAWSMQYLSKETLYQYGDEAHLNEWLGKIEEVRAKVEELNLINEYELLSDLDSYKIVALKMGEMVIDRANIMEEKNAQILKLRKLSDELREVGGEISVSMNLRNEYLARNVFVVIIGITLFGMILIFVVKKYFLFGRINGK